MHSVHCTTPCTPFSAYNILDTSLLYTIPYWQTTPYNQIHSVHCTIPCILFSTYHILDTSLLYTIPCCITDKQHVMIRCILYTIPRPAYLSLYTTAGIPPYSPPFHTASRTHYMLYIHTCTYKYSLSTNIVLTIDTRYINNTDVLM
jgi:hypothetical protein